MKYRENVCQYKNFSSISIVSGSNISHTSSRNRQKNPMGLQLSLAKASRSPSNPVCCLVFQPPPSRISRMAKHLPQYLRQEFLSSSCSGEEEWKYKLDLICSAWLCVLNVCTFSTLTAVKGHCRADQYLEAVVGVDGAGDPRGGAHKIGGAGASPHTSLGQLRAWLSCYLPG